MSRYVAILILILLTVFTIVIISYYFLTAERRNREWEYSVKTALRTYQEILPGSIDIPPFKQTRYNYKVYKSDGQANVINNLRECTLWASHDRIHGGSKAEIGEYPCIALLEYVVGHDKYSFDCAGSLINHRYVITAAHCLVGNKLVNIRLGEYNIETDPDKDESGADLPPPINTGVENFIVHPEYDQSKTINDIGLIRLSKDIPFATYYIMPICIPNSTMITAVGSFVSVAGWGSTGEVKRSNILQTVNLPIFNFTECQQIQNQRPILSSQFCAGGEQGKDACYRDSGGPVVAKFHLNTYLEGIVSYGYGCGGNGTPGIYTRVGYYYDWIQQNLQP